jgi:hypothetical protein
MFVFQPRQNPPRAEVDGYSGAGPVGIGHQG